MSDFHATSRSEAVEIPSEVLDLAFPEIESRMRFVMSEDNAYGLTQETNEIMAEMEVEDWRLVGTQLAMAGNWTTVLLLFEREKRS